MKKNKLITSLFVLLMLFGCSSKPAVSEKNQEPVTQQTESDNSKREEKKTDQKKDTEKSDSEQTDNSSDKVTDPKASPAIAPTIGRAPVKPEDIPKWKDGDQPFTELHGNKPYFQEEDLIGASYEHYGDLDSLGRVTLAYASIGRDLMPTEKRGSIENIHPTGWKQADYSSIDGGKLYNRCHLIGFQLTSQNANEKNLMTGTRYFNVEGMLRFENMVADYIKETNNHVLYRTTPLFTGSNLLADGIVLEAKSVEDDGDGVEFCVFCYNVQPGIKLNYADGSSQAEDPSAEDNEREAKPAIQPQTVPEETKTYILNTNTHKFHLPDCKSVKKMKDKNKEVFTGTRDQVIAKGYEPCKICNP